MVAGSRVGRDQNRSKMPEFIAVTAALVGGVDGPIERPRQPEHGAPAGRSWASA